VTGWAPAIAEHNPMTDKNSVIFLLGIPSASRNVSDNFVWSQYGILTAIFIPSWLSTLIYRTRVSCNSNPGAVLMLHAKPNTWCGWKAMHHAGRRDSTFSGRAFS
jgi:hypothetical protein